MSALILLIYNPNNVFADFRSDDTLVAQDGIGYIIVGKSRFGFKKGAPGAIQVSWDGLAGWGEESLGYMVF